jgi:hypothetical protein
VYKVSAMALTWGISVFLVKALQKISCHCIYSLKLDLINILVKLGIQVTEY